MSCEHLHSTLTDVALGASVPPQLQSHLDACSACRAALEGERAVLAEIDREIQDLMSATPSPALASRVRHRLEDTAAAHPRPLIAWLLPATAVVGLLLIGFLLVRRAPTDRRDTPAPSAVQAVETTDVAPRPHEVLQQPHPTTAPHRPMRVASRRPVRPVEPEVLIPQEDRIALERYHERLRHRRVQWHLFRAGQPRHLDVLPAVATLDDSSLVQIVTRSIDTMPLVTSPTEQESQL
jgi:hypothetical protein